MSHFKVWENEIVGGGIKVVKFHLFSCTLFISYLKTPENVIVGAGVSWCVERVHELNKLPTPHTYTFSSFEVGKGKRQRKKM